MARAREPERTCVACRGKGPKRDLLRVVRAPDGAVRIDPGGKAAGRGAYVHRDRACARTAIERGALVRALRARLDPDGAARLRDDIEREVGP